MIKIIGGKFKRKRINVPNDKVRPTSAKKREAIFSILQSYAINNSFDLYADKCVIDLFAGSGSLGLEAISRGASFAYFYELDNNVIKILEENCQKICVNKEFQIIQQDCKLIDFSNLNFSPSIIFIDPPYKYLSFDEILGKIVESKILNKKTIIVIESNKENILKISKNYQVIQKKTYGKTQLYFLIKL